MTDTLAGLKAEIADDLARPDLTSQIASAISSAIDFYKPERFWFNVSRTASFVTVAGQSLYTTSDDADIPLFYEVDAVFCTDSSGIRTELDEEDAAELEYLIGNSGSARARPESYARFNDGFLLYGTPDAVYTILPMGHIDLAAPATDGETGNAWVTHGKGYELIRCRAKAYLYTHIVKELDQARIMVVAEDSAVQALRSTTSRKTATGRIAPTSF